MFFTYVSRGHIWYFLRFFSRAILIDTAYNETHYFVTNIWFADNVGDGVVDRTFSVATDAELHNSEHLFFTHTNR